METLRTGLINNKRSHSQSKKPSHQCFSWIKLLVWCFSKRMPNTSSQVKTSMRKLNPKAFKLLGCCRAGVLQLAAIGVHQTAVGKQALTRFQALHWMCFNLPPSHGNFRNVSVNNKRSHSQSKKPSHQCFSWMKLLVWCFSKRMPNTSSQVKTSIRKLNQKAFKLLGFCRAGVLQLLIVSFSGSSYRGSPNCSRQASSHTVPSIALDVLQSASFTWKL